MSRRAKLILNPIPWARRAWSALPEIVGVLEEAGIKVDVTFTKMTEAMTQSVQHAVEEDYTMVIAGGGDGTISEVAAGLVGTGVPLGILPFGTFNNIAHSLGIPFNLVEAASNIAQGNMRRIDVGMANGTYFFEAAGVGLDASLFPIGEEIKGGHYEKLLEGAKRFIGHQRAEFDLVIDGNKVNVRSPLIVVANGPYYGAGFTVAPQADLSDGMLDIITFECSKVEITRQFALSARNREHQEICVLAHQAKEVTVLPRLPLPAHADGKPIATAPVTCSVVPSALSVIAPKSPPPRHKLS